jgi:hypothetical protein
VISGQILNEEGDPLPWISVLALSNTYSGGKFEIKTVEESSTDDAGRYRLFNLPPGTYFVLAVNHLEDRGDQSSNSGPVGARQAKLSYVPTFYPGVTSFVGASALMVTAGSEQPNINLVLSPVPIFSVQGKVTNSINSHANDDTIVKLYPQERGPTGSFPDFQSFVDEKSGQFRIDNVPPGSYVIEASWSDAGRTHSGRRSFELTSSDLKDLDVNIGHGANLSGRVSWEPPSAPENQELFVVLDAIEEAPLVSKSSKTKQNGSFEFADVTDGDYEIRVYDLPVDSFVKSMHYASAEVLGRSLKIRSGVQGSLQITLSLNGAKIEGTAVDSNSLPVPGARVTLLSDDAEFLKTLVKETTADQQGKFVIRGIRPGDYHLYGWDETERDVWGDGTLVKSLKEKGQQISLGEGEQKQIAVKMVTVDKNPTP